jgi:hypothetical protein
MSPIRETSSWLEIPGISGGIGKNIRSERLDCCTICESSERGILNLSVDEVLGDASVKDESDWM